MSGKIKCYYEDCVTVCSCGVPPRGVFFFRDFSHVLHAPSFFVLFLGFIHVIEIPNKH